MNLKNGYKVLYADRSEGQTTFYATTDLPKKNPDGDEVIASFADEDYKGRLVYSNENSIYVAEKQIPDLENDERLSSFDTLFHENP